MTEETFRLQFTSRCKSLNEQLVVATATGDQSEIGRLSKELGDLDREMSAAGANYPWWENP